MRGKGYEGNLYRNKIDVRVLIYDEHDFNFVKKNLGNTSWLTEISKKISKRLSLEKDIMIINQDNELFIILDDEQVNKIKNITQRDKKLRETLKEVILNAF